MTITVREHACREHVAPILAALRPEDQFEFACAGIVDHESVHDFIEAANNESWVFHLDGRPVFVWGVFYQPGGRLAQLWGFGTSETPKIMRFAMKWGMRFWLPKVFAAGVTRIEVRVPIKSEHSLSWLIKLGMRPESWDIHDYSVNGERMVQLSYTTREFQKRNVHFHADTDGRQPGDGGGGSRS